MLRSDEIVGCDLTARDLGYADHDARPGDALARPPFLYGMLGAAADQFSHFGVTDPVGSHVGGKLHDPIVGPFSPFVKPALNTAKALGSNYHVSMMGNGLRDARIKARMNIEQAAVALGISRSGYVKIERSERRLTADLIRRACELFGVSAEELIGEAGGVALNEQIDPNKLASLITLARERLGSLPEIEAKNLILALISASRRPPNPGEDPRN